MRYFEFTVLFTFLMDFQVSTESRYDCSQFNGYNGSLIDYPLIHPLVECPQAKFMLKDNLVECFDNHTKLVINSTSYWCMSRQDIDEHKIKDLMVTPAYINNELDDIIFKSFSTRYHFNGTHFKCHSEEKWAGLWFKIDVDSVSPCMTDTKISINMKYNHSADNL